MRRTITFTILSFLISFTSISSQVKVEESIATEATMKAVDSKSKAIIAENEEANGMPITTIEFSSTEFNWGSVNEGEKIQNVFEFTNTGTEPLIIINAKGSCGCTVPRWPREPIAPGATANILVQFDSKKKGRKGGALQSKRVTITTNTEPKNTYLTIKGTVFKPKTSEELAAKSADFDIDANTVNIFPNPSSNMINLNIKEFAGQTASVEIYNTMGQRIDSKIIDEIGQGDTPFDISTYISGTYTMSIKIEGLNRIAKQFHVL